MSTTVPSDDSLTVRSPGNSSIDDLVLSGAVLEERLTSADSRGYSPFDPRVFLVDTCLEATMRPETYVAGSLLIALAACASSPEVSAGPSTPGVTGTEFEARPTADGVEFTNRGATTIYYRAHDPLSLALSDRIPCLEPAHCPHVPAQSRVTVPFEEAIVGYRSDTERATVYWWHFVPQPDGSPTPDEVRTFEVIF